MRLLTRTVASLTIIFCGLACQFAAAQTATPSPAATYTPAPSTTPPAPTPGSFLNVLSATELSASGGLSLALRLNNNNSNAASSSSQSFLLFANGLSSKTNVMLARTTSDNAVSLDDTVTLWNSGNAGSSDDGISTMLGVYAGAVFNHGPVADAVPPIVFLCLSRWMGVHSAVSSRIMRVETTQFDEPPPPLITAEATLKLGNVTTFFDTNTTDIASCAISLSHGGDNINSSSMLFCFGSKLYQFPASQLREKNAASTPTAAAVVTDLSKLLASVSSASSSPYTRIAAAVAVDSVLFVIPVCFSSTDGCTLLALSVSPSAASNATAVVASAALPSCANYGRAAIAAETVVGNTTLFYLVCTGQVVKLQYDWPTKSLALVQSFLAPSISSSTVTVTPRFVYFRTSHPVAQIARVDKKSLAFDAATAGWAVKGYPVLGQFGASVALERKRSTPSPSAPPSSSIRGSGDNHDDDEDDDVIFTNGGAVPVAEEEEGGFAFVVGSGVPNNETTLPSTFTSAATPATSSSPTPTPAPPPPPPITTAAPTTLAPASLSPGLPSTTTTQPVVSNSFILVFEKTDAKTTNAAAQALPDTASLKKMLVALLKKQPGWHSDREQNLFAVHVVSNTTTHSSSSDSLLTTTIKFSLAVSPSAATTPELQSKAAAAIRLADKILSELAEAEVADAFGASSFAVLPPGGGTSSSPPSSPPPKPTAPATPSPSKVDSSFGLILGVGGASVVIVLIAGCYFLVRRKESSSSRDDGDEGGNDHHHHHRSDRAANRAAAAAAAVENSSVADDKSELRSAAGALDDETPSYANYTSINQHGEEI